MRSIEGAAKVRAVSVGGGILLVGAIGTVDYYTGYDLSSAFFYLLPITLVAWYAGRTAGLLVAALAIVASTLVNVGSIDAREIPAFYYYWNTALRFGFFLIVALLVAALHRALDAERRLSRTDYLTGAANARSFEDLVQHEVDRSRRSVQPFALAYIDLDNFKKVNDTHGHNAGDELLRRVVSVMQHSLRRTDTVARLGGDEFALLLPETGMEAAQSALAKLREALLDDMDRSNMPVTFSIGVVICQNTSCRTDSLIKAADDLMYEVKRAGKNSLAFRPAPADA